MPAKQLHFGTTARSDIQRGVDKLANAVKITLGHGVVMWSWIKHTARRYPPRMA